MNVRTLALITAAVWTPIVAGADTSPRLKDAIGRPAARCLSESQILSNLRRKGYNAGRRDMARHGGVYIVSAVRHRAKVAVKVDGCTGRILSVQAAREATRLHRGIDRLRAKPHLVLKCLSKQAIYQKLRAKGYTYLKLEQITGPYSTSGGKVYRLQTLVKEGPRWCQVKMTVNCTTGQITNYDRLENTCIY